MTIKFTNNAATLLSTGSLADDDTSVAVDDGSVFPALSAGEFFYATLIRANALTTREIVKVTARSGNTLTIVRAQDNTSATTFSADDHIELRIVAATLESLKAADELTAGDAAVTLATSAGNITIDAQGNDTDIILKGTDGSSDTTFVTIDGSDAGTASFNHDVKLANDAAVLGFGAGNDVTLTHVHDTGLLLNGTMQLQFNDASQNITAPSATVLDINATDEVEINATLADVNANLDVSGTYTGGGTMTTGGNIVVPDGGNIGSASDTDAMSISSGGVVAFSAVPTFPNDTIETADIQDNAVTLAKMAGLARGKIIYGDSSGDPAALAVGSANTFLKSDGTDVSWAALSGTAADDISTGDAAVSIATSAGNITIDAQGDDTDIILKGTDGGADTTFLTIDGSDAGTASFNHDVKLASDAAVLGFGAGNDVTLTHVHNSGLTLSAGANHTHFTITSTEDGTSAGPRLSFTRDSTSPADGDDLGMIYFKGKNDADEETQYARIYAEAVDVADGTEDARLRLQVRRNGTQTSAITIDDEVGVTGAASFDTMPSTPNPGFRAYRASNFTLSHATWTKVSLDTKNWDVGGYFDNSTNYRFTPLVQGYYQVNAGLQDASNNDVYDIIMNLYYNGSTAKQSRLRIKGATSTRDFYTSTVKDSDIIYFDGVDDYLEMYAYIARGGSGGCTLLGGSPRIFMSAMLLSRTG